MYSAIYEVGFFPIVTFQFIFMYYLHVHCYSYHIIISFFLQGTGDSEEPPEKKKPIWHFMPTSHTCSNSLDLPRGNEVLPLPLYNELFELYDLAFKNNNYFGLM